MVGYDLAFAEELPFVDYQAVEADGIAGVDFVGADADFGAQGVTVAVAETRTGVREDVGGIDEVHETFGFLAVGGFRKFLPLRICARVRKVRKICGGRRDIET